MADAFDELRRVIGRRLTELDELAARATMESESRALDRSRQEIRLIWHRFLTTGTSPERRYRP